MSYQTSTHFDPTALLTIKNEVDNSITQVEAAVNSLVEDQTLPFGIDDALNQLEQCARVLALIEIPQLAKIASYSAELMRKIMAQSKNIQTQDITVLSESTCMLKRYIEFICLREIEIPLFLLETLNQLEIALGKSLTPVGKDVIPLLSFITPDFNLPPSTIFSEKSAYIHQLYKLSLNRLLKGKANPFDIKAIQLVGSYLVNTAQQQPSKQYWELVSYTFSHIENMILNKPRLRIFIEIEANIRQFLNVPERFKANLAELADILSLCISQEDEIAQHIRHQLNIDDNFVRDTQVKLFSQQFFGPDYETIHTISTLVTHEISQIHVNIEQNYPNIAAEKIQEIQHNLQNLANIFKVLNLLDIAQQLIQQSQILGQDQFLKDERLAEQFMSTMLSAINSVGILERQHNSQRLQLPVNNMNIALDRLDDAYHTLLTETHLSVEMINHSLTQYLQNQDIKELETVPNKLRDIGGALLFLNIMKGQQAFNAVANFIDYKMLSKTLLTATQIDLILNTLASADLLIDNLKSKQPVLHSMFDVALESSEKLKSVA